MCNDGFILSLSILEFHIIGILSRCKNQDEMAGTPLFILLSSNLGSQAKATIAAIALL